MQSDLVELIGEPSLGALTLKPGQALRSACVTASVCVSPVSLASASASLSVSGFLMFRATASPHVNTTEVEDRNDLAVSETPRRPRDLQRLS
jgi:hypothetical protein